MTRSWSFGTTRSLPSIRQDTPSRAKPSSVERRCSTPASAMRISDPVTAARPMNEPTSMWSGPMRCVAPPSVPAALDRQLVRANAVDLRAQRDEKMTEILDVRLARGVPEDRRARWPRPRPSAAFSVAVTLGSSRKTSAPRRPGVER